MVRAPHLHCRGHQVQSLVRELRCHKNVLNPTFLSLSLIEMLLYGDNSPIGRPVLQFTQKRQGHCLTVFFTSFEENELVPYHILKVINYCLIFIGIHGLHIFGGF